MRGISGAALAMALVGSLTGVSATIQDYPFFGGQAIRYAVAAAILLTIARRRGRGPRLSWRDGVLLVALAATGLAGFNLCIVTATRHVSPAMVGTVIASVPVVLALAGPLQQHRRPAIRTVVAAVVVTVGAGVATGLGSGDLAGLLWSLGALAGESGFSLLAIPLLPKLGPIRVSGFAAAFAVPMLLAAGAVTDGRGMLRAPTLSELAAYTYIVVVVTVVAFLLWYDALGRLGADRAGLFAGVIPISAVATTMILGMGVPRPAELAGAALVGVGVVIGMVRPRTAGRRVRLDSKAAGQGRTLVRAAREDA